MTTKYLTALNIAYIVIVVEPVKMWKIESTWPLCSGCREYGCGRRCR